MGIEWFRDLSITILGFVTTAVLIFTAILAYRLYRKAKAVLDLAKSAAKIARDTVSMIQESVKPMLPIMAIIQAVRSGFEFVRKMCNKESNEEGDDNE